MRQAILIGDDDLAQLRGGGSLELTLGDQSLTLLYVAASASLTPQAKRSVAATNGAAPRKLGEGRRDKLGRLWVYTKARQRTFMRVNKKQNRRA